MLNLRKTLFNYYFDPKLYEQFPKLKIKICSIFI